jgi:hypothetical protein
MKKISIAILLSTSFLYGGFFDSIKEFLPQENTSSKTTNTTNTNSSTTNSLLNSITSSTDLTTTQATGTVGTLMQYAKSNMTESEYSTVTKDVPVLNSLGNSASSSMLSSLTNSAMSSDMVTSTLKTMGVDPAIVQTVIPIIVNYAKQYGSEESGSILSKSLSGLLN